MTRVAYNTSYEMKIRPYVNNQLGNKGSINHVKQTLSGTKQLLEVLQLLIEVKLRLSFNKFVR
jgi:hypothetical protein